MPPAKRRRTQSSVLSFFQPGPPTPPSTPPTPPSIPSAPPSAAASPLKPAEPTAAPAQQQSCAVVSLYAGVDVRPAPAPLSVVALPGVLTPVGTPVAPPTFDLDAEGDAVDEIEDDDDDWHPISRLSRSRNVARRVRLRSASRQQVCEIEPAGTTPETVAPSSADRSPGAEVTSEPWSQPPSPRPKKLHPFFASKDAENPSAQKKFHPFFAATAAAVSSGKERKRPRPVIPSADAWECPSATVHINAPPPLGRFQRTEVQQPARGTPVTPVDFSCYSGTADVELRPVENAPCESADTWAERYKRDRRIDVINGAATKELVDWLRAWYEMRDQTEISDDSQDSYVMPNANGDRERVAIVTGPVGCGKSTVITNAARQLGLSILEINASVCRTGKRIREIIGEALSTHRVTHRSVFQTFKQRVEPAAKTLILFEEVDELHDDEKGFWSTIQKLAASSDCRRPIVCTANSFTSHMRQYFLQARATIEEDLDRLLLNSRVEQLVNPIEYKLIEFQTRSERQAAAVIKRVCSTESADAVSDVANCLALSCRDDTRKAINLLHFWGAKGLVHKLVSSPRRTRGSPRKRGRHGRRSIESQGRIGTGLVEGASPDDHVASSFHVGSLNYASSRSRKRNSHNPAQCDEALDAWCTSLDAMSYADVIEGAVEREKSRRSFELSEEPFDACMDTDVHQAAEIVREIDGLSLQYSVSYLSFGSGAQHVCEIAKEAANGRSAQRNYISSRLPLPRRPISLEYLPILRSMALADEKACGGPGSSGEGHDRPMRRTRARARQGGFSSLDLDPITILALKKTAMRASES